MNRQEAIKALMRAGQGEAVKTTIDAKLSKAQARFEEVRRDSTRTDEYKRWALAVAASQANRALTDELVAMASRAVADDRDDAERVFGVRGLDGDPASLVISRRDAGDRVASIGNKADLRAILARATRSGDEVLARAAAERALELRDADTLNLFLETRPQLDGAVERLWKAEQSEEHGLGMTMRLAGLKPSELDGSSFSSIDAIADAGEPRAAATTW